MATKTRAPARKAAAKTAARTAAAAAKPAATKAARGAKTAPQSAAKAARQPSTKGIDSLLAGAVRDSAQQIWLAGMGAFAKAQEEGNRVFEALVKDGMNLQRKTQAVAEEKIGEVTDRMSAMADNVSARAGQNWDKLETIFEQRTAKAMSRLGVPTARDVQMLAERVDALAAAVAKLSRARGAAPAAEPAAAAEETPARQRRRRVTVVTADSPTPAAPAAAQPQAPVEVPAADAPRAGAAKPARTRRAAPAAKTPVAEAAAAASGDAPADAAPEAATIPTAAAAPAEAPTRQRASRRKAS